MRAPTHLAIVLLAGLAALSGADATAGVPAPSASAAVPALDADTLARANAAADAYAKADAAAHTPPSQAARDAIAAAEINLLEARTYLDQGDVAHGGDCYLAARKLITDIPAADRPLLGARLTAARDAVAALSQRMLAADQRSLSEFPATGADAEAGGGATGAVAAPDRKAGP
jgi:hypothetical protein